MRKTVIACFLFVGVLIVLAFWFKLFALLILAGILLVFAIGVSLATAQAMDRGELG